jgi:hypothetical protein
MVSFILPGNSATGGYDVANSLRFNSGSTDSLSRTPSSASNRRTFTISMWFKRSSLTSDNGYSALFTASSGDSGIFLNNDGTLEWYEASGQLDTSRVFRDVSAWYHVVVAFDTTQGTASNRVKLYINGVQETAFDTESYPSENAEGLINNTAKHAIGVRATSTNMAYGGYMAEVVLIDGTALDPTSFGEFDSDSGIWKPIDVSGLTFGTNGFYLDFENSGSLGADVSGNGNNFTVNNLTSIDQSTDTCTNNFATMNGLLLSVASLNFTDGNLTNNGNSSSTWRTMYSTIGASSGKWYFEVRINKTKTSDPNNFIIGIQDAEQMFQASNTAEISSTSRGYGYRGNGGNKVNNTTGTGSSYGDSYGSIGDIIGCAVDLDNHKIYFRKNGTYQNSGDPTSGATGTGSAFDLTTGITYMFGISSYYDDDRHSFNFGSPPYSESGGNSDGNGYGNFAGSVPSGYYALNTKNLAEYG